eukprot:214312-Pyramimonas_sp.AAC.1
MEGFISVRIGRTHQHIGNDLANVSCCITCVVHNGTSKRVLAQVYQRRIETLINKLDEMQDIYSVRPPEAGLDFFSHSFREWNQRADLLTHQARQGHVYADFVYL